MLTNSVFKLSVTDNLIRNTSSILNRRSSTTPVNIKPFLNNRNPRNLEKLRIARKPTGYHLDNPGRLFWHKVSIIQKPRHIVAQVCHNNGKVAVHASTNEWGINKHLYRCNDMNAYINLARILAERCMESGINEMINGIDEHSEKRKQFIKHFEEAGIMLYELPTYNPLTPWTPKVDEKPWKVHID